MHLALVRLLVLLPCAWSLDSGAAPRAREEAGLCEEAPVNWTAIREDLVTYATLSEPKHRSRRCFGLDPGVWSYCGIAAVRLLSMQPGLINGGGSTEDKLGFWAVPRQHWNPCPVGLLSLTIFTLIFLTPGERHGMLYDIGHRLDGTGLSFEQLRHSRWPVFGLLARLSEQVAFSGEARPVDQTCTAALSAPPGAAGPHLPQVVTALQEEMASRAAQRRPVPEDLSQQLVQLLDAEPARRRLEAPGCLLALASAWAGAAEVAGLQGRGDAAVATAVMKAEGALRRLETNYTHLDWLSTRWPLFRLLHRLQFKLLLPPPLLDMSPPADLVPRDSMGRPLRFTFNHGIGRPDALNIDIAADIVHTDLLRSLPPFFGMRPAWAGELWHLNFVYTSSEYADLTLASELWRLKARSQKMALVPGASSIVGEKDRMCRTHQGALRRWHVQPSLGDLVGGVPACFELPGAKQELREFAQGMPSEAKQAFVRKPEGGWGGRGIEIRFGVDDLLGDSSRSADQCTFTPFEDVQCLGLQAASAKEAAASASACQAACCRALQSCSTWNWRSEEGCWLGAATACSSRSASHLGGWYGGHRVQNEGHEPRAVVQRYVMDPILYELEGIHPPVRVKTDIRVYGTVVSLDPLRVFVSRHGFFRSGYLERNYSAETDDDLRDRLMHVTHHIPKIESGSYQCPNAPSWGGGEGSAEREAGSGGSLHKWLRIVEEQNGLDPEVVWRHVRLVIGLFMLEARTELSCQANPVQHACGSAGFHFFADLVVDSTGRAWLMEVHPTLGIKSHGLGDPEGGWVEVLTRHTRQGALGTLAAFFVGRANHPYKNWAERLVRQRLLNQGRWQTEVLRVLRQRGRDRAAGLGASGEEPTLAALLARMLLEEHMSCRLSLQSVLPGLWRDVGRHVRPKPAAARGASSGDPFGGGLRPLYKLYEAARVLVRRATRLQRAPGDLRPRRCEPVDFNLGTVWDQPWERASRRFKV